MPLLSSVAALEKKEQTVLRLMMRRQGVRGMMGRFGGTSESSLLVTVRPILVAHAGASLAASGNVALSSSLSHECIRITFLWYTQNWLQSRF